MNNKASRIIPSIVLYLLAIALAIFSIWAYSQCSEIVAQVRDAGQLTTTGLDYDVVSFYMVNSGLYFALAVLIAACGLILQRKQPAPAEAASLAAPLGNEIVEYGNAEDVAVECEIVEQDVVEEVIVGQGIVEEDIVEEDVAGDEIVEQGIVEDETVEQDIVEDETAEWRSEDEPADSAKPEDE